MAVDTGTLRRQGTGRATRSPERRELYCARCGYGVVVLAAPPACPMCRANAWRPLRTRTAEVTSEP